MTPAAERSLARAAVAARRRAHAPYSKYAVGAALRFADGSTVRGANVENASYGLTVCAERVALFAAVAAGKGAPVALAVATKDGASPCGACRQVLREFAPPPADARLEILSVDARGRVVARARLSDLLPRSFGPESLGTSRRPRRGDAR